MQREAPDSQLTMTLPTSLVGGGIFPRVCNQMLSAILIPPLSYTIRSAIDATADEQTEYEYNFDIDVQRLPAPGERE